LQGHAGCCGCTDVLDCNTRHSRTLLRTWSGTVPAEFALRQSPRTGCTLNSGPRPSAGTVPERPTAPNRPPESGRMERLCRIGGPCWMLRLHRCVRLQYLGLADTSLDVVRDSPRRVRATAITSDQQHP
jgi:hypothetical protein